MSRRRVHAVGGRAQCALLLAVAVAALHAEEEPTPVVRFEVSAFAVEGPDPLAPGESARVLAPFLGAYEGLDGLLAAADALEGEYAARGYGFHRVTLPPQTLNGGQVVLRVVVFRLGEVRVEGEARQSEEFIRGTLPSLVPGETPSTRALTRDLFLANQNQARNLAVSFADGAGEDTVDARVNVTERRPWQFIAALNNQGNDTSGESRMSGGVQYANLWNRDHRLGFTYTFAPDRAGDISQYAINYLAPVYGAHSQLGFFYVQSDVDIGQVGGIDISGAGRFIGATWTRALMKHGRYGHQLSASFQDREFTSDADFAGLTVDSPDSRSRPVTLQYDGNWRDERIAAAFYLAAVKNLAGGPFNDDASYAVVRPGASTSWEAVRFGANLAVNLPRDWLFRWLLDGQYTTARLIPGEQFGVGGLNSVRGFQERAMAGDTGFRSAVEFWLPALRSVPGVRALTFLDGGYRDFNGADAVGGDETVLAAGLGLRWQWKQTLTATLDWANPIDFIDRGPQNDRRFYLTLLLRY